MAVAVEAARTDDVKLIDADMDGDSLDICAEAGIDGTAAACFVEVDPSTESISAARPEANLLRATLPFS